MKSISVLLVVTVACGVGALFGCGTNPRPSELRKEINYEWVAVSEHGVWEISARVDTFRTDTADAWKAAYRIERYGYFDFTCRALPPPEGGVSGISYSFEYQPLGVIPFRPNKMMIVKAVVDGNSVVIQPYLSDDPDEEQHPISTLPGNAERILNAFRKGSESELHILDGGRLVHSTTIPLTGFKKASNWVLQSCMAAAG